MPSPIGPYRPLRQLGQGGMGSVYEVEDARTRARYALKLIPLEALDPDALARLRREAEAMARAAHPHVARIHAANFAPPQCYLVLDLYPGGDLARRLKHGAFAPAEARALVAQLADGLAHAHAQGVIHRDVKPENVLFDAEGRPVLADFGLSRGAPGERLTLTGELLGSPLYMAPEQMTDAKLAGPPADVYGLGAVLYHLLTGRPPFLPQSTLLATLAQVQTTRPPAPRELAPAVPRELERLCLQALDPDPAARPSAEAFAQDLRAPQAARRPGLVPLAAAGALALAALTLGLAWASRSGPTDTADPADEADPADPVDAGVEPPPAGRSLPVWIQDLDGRSVLLSLTSKRHALTVLAESQLLALPEGRTAWRLTPRRARAERGGPASATPRLGELAQVDSSLAPALFSGPLELTFDAAGDLAAAASPLDPLSKPVAGTLARFAWRELRAEALRAHVEALLELPERRAADLTPRVRTRAPTGSLLGLVLVTRWGELALQPVSAGRVVETSERGVARVALRAPASEPAECLDGALAAANGTTPAGLGELALLEVPLALAPPHMPFRTLRSGEEPRVFSRPWGSPLGRLALPGPQGLGYLIHGTSGEWTAVGWEAGVAWVRVQKVAPGKNPYWVATVCSGARPLEVFLEKVPVGVLRHGQRVAVRHAGDTFGFEGLPGTSIPSLNSPRIEISWGGRVAHVRSSVDAPDHLGYLLNLVLVRPDEEPPRGLDLDALPEVVHSAGVR